MTKKEIVKEMDCPECGGKYKLRYGKYMSSDGIIGETIVEGFPYYKCDCGEVLLTPEICEEMERKRGIVALEIVWKQWKERTESPKELMDCLLSPEETESLQTFGLHGEPMPMCHVESIAKAQLAKVAPLLEAAKKAERIKIIDEIQSVMSDCDDIRIMEKALTDYITDEQAKMGGK